MIGIILLILIAVAVAVGLGIYFSKKQDEPKKDVNVTSTIVDGKTQLTNNAIVTRSLDQKEGITFAYTCWLRFNGFEYKYGYQKVIFTKGAGDLSSMCPGVFLDATTNTILVKMDTFGAQEVIPINNIPAQKWMHFAIVVNQTSIEIYVNGVLHTHKTLVQLPKQNSRTVQTGINGGFDGAIANLKYYNYYLTPADVKSLMGSPPDTVTDSANFKYDWWLKN